MVAVDRRTSFVHCALDVSTISVLWTSRTAVEPCSAGPTAVAQAKATLPGDVGVFRSSSRSARGTTWDRARMKFTIYNKQLRMRDEDSGPDHEFPIPHCKL